MGDEWINDYLVVYIERDVACRVDNKDIMQWFQNMKKAIVKLHILGFLFFFCDVYIFRFSFILYFVEFMLFIDL